MKVIKPKLLLYEGIDGSGKSTLQKAVNKCRGYTDLSLNRFTPSMWVYSMYRNEPVYELNDTVEFILDNYFDLYVVWCVCSPVVAYERCIGKFDEDNLGQLTEQSILYTTYFNSITKYSKIIKVETDKFPLDICVKKVVERIQYVDIR